METKIEIDDEEAPTAAKEMLLQNNDIALSAIHNTLDERTFEQIKNIERAHEVAMSMQMAKRVSLSRPWSLNRSSHEIEPLGSSLY